jgi:N-acetylneuraminic acid mutarotase
MKKLIMLSLFTYTLSYTPAYAQGTWTSRDTLLDSAMFQGIPGFSIGNYGYAGLGDQYGSFKTSNKLWRFNPSTNSWTQMASFPGSARVAPANFVIGNKAYLVTGSLNNGGTCVTECWEYDATTNVWTQKTNFPGAARTYATAFAIGRKGYVGTGGDNQGTFFKDFYAYDTATNTWTRIADFAGKGRNGDCGFAVNGKGYVCFGQDSTVFGLKDMWEYDTGSDTWTQKTNAPNSMVGGSGFAICNNIYVGSGSSSAYFGGGDFNQFWKYNTLSDTWTQEANVPGVSKLQGAAFAIADSGYYGFGCDSVVHVRNIFDKFYGGDSCNYNISTGNDIIADALTISIYPNPNNGVFSVICNSEQNEESPPIIEIYNMVGLKVFTGTLSSKGENTIKMSNQPSGIYTVSIHRDNLIINKKLLITN